MFACSQTKHKNETNKTNTGLGKATSGAVHGWRDEPGSEPLRLGHSFLPQQLFF